MASVITPQGLICFPALFTPKEFNGDLFYSCVLVLDEAAQQSQQYQALRQAVLNAATEKFGAKATDMFRSNSLRTPFRDGASKEYQGFGAGKTFITAKTKERPGVVDWDLNDMVPSDVYPGCQGRLSVAAYAYDFQGNRGVALALNNVQITSIDQEKFPRLDGRKDAANEFDRMAGSGARTPASVPAGDDLPF